MAGLADDIQQMIAPVLQSMGYELVGIEYIRAKDNILRIYIDKQSGVFINDCAQASEQISRILDIEEPISSAYHLEVSSPGVKRPLFTLAHYQRFLGSWVKIELNKPLSDTNNQRRFIGEIKVVYEQKETIEISRELDSVLIPFHQIQKANLVVDFT